MILAIIVAQTSGAEPKPIRLVRSVSGTKGGMDGSRFVVEDPRTTFFASQDRQVLVHFEWEGSPGPHEYEAHWKDPSGAVVLVSPFKQTSNTSRFGVYWALVLAETARPGLWAVEAKVDGQTAGIHTFTVKATHDGNEVVEPGRRPLSPADLYARAQQAILTVEALDGKGERLSAGAGFLVAEDLVATAFQVIEGASSVRIVTPSGAPIQTDVVQAWHRRQDWAVFRTSPISVPHLKLDRSGAGKVGDRCSFLNVSPDGVRTMAVSEIVGTQSFPDAGPRYSLAQSIQPGSIGAPLLNEFGDVIAMVGGTLTPGATAGGTRTLLANPVAIPTTFQTMAVPLSALPMEWPASPARLSDLTAKGVFIPPVVGPRNVITGTLARDVEMRNGIAFPVGEKFEFSRREGEALAYLTLDPQEKRDGLATFKIFDLDNRPVLQGSPSKIRLRPREYSVMRWKFPLGPFTPATYRIDLCIDSDVIWRGFFRIVD